ncbi:helix-turn-helix domain-containing protein [Kineosporia babensis]|uniref:Uncharacterized protein n=1 Tax=Kineosporia babensis TaxID=499548 RepID=A0A9X1NN83_9ACTN|nr:hypothetical protein [Kineosporia babensis]MCD5316831.1 hypothetical protein [Kineosporia babensis]
METSVKTQHSIGPLPEALPSDLTINGAVTVVRWNGKMTEALRYALRRPIVDFARYLGVSPRTVSKWASRGDQVVLTLPFQSILDAALERSSEDERNRFIALCHDEVPLVILTYVKDEARDDTSDTAPRSQTD